MKVGRIPPQQALALNFRLEQWFDARYLHVACPAQRITGTRLNQLAQELPSSLVAGDRTSSSQLGLSPLSQDPAEAAE